MLKMLMMVRGYPVGTYINASSKGAPYNLPTTPWNTLKASDSKEIALMTANKLETGTNGLLSLIKDMLHIKI